MRLPIPKESLELVKRTLTAASEVTGDTAPTVRHLAQAALNAISSPELQISNLTRRERQVFGLIGQGADTKQIAISLGVSTKTVGVHACNIKGKLGLPHGRAVLVAALRANGVKVAMPVESGVAE